MAGEKNIGPTTVKFSSVIVLDKNDKCIFYPRSDLFTSL